MRVATLTVHDAEGAWTETYKEGESASFGRADADLYQWAARLIGKFNDTLRPHEKPRILDTVKVSEVDDKAQPLDHDWHKTNLVTVEQRGQYFDVMACTRCPVTGRRYGLTHVKRDAKFKAKKYDHCQREAK